MCKFLAGSKSHIPYWHIKAPAILSPLARTSVCCPEGKAGAETSPGSQKSLWRALHSVIQTKGQKEGPGLEHSIPPLSPFQNPVPKSNAREQQHLKERTFFERKYCLLRLPAQSKSGRFRTKYKDLLNTVSLPGSFCMRITASQHLSDNPKATGVSLKLSPPPAALENSLLQR